MVVPAELQVGVLPDVVFGRCKSLDAGGSHLCLPRAVLDSSAELEAIQVEHHQGHLVQSSCSLAFEASGAKNEAFALSAGVHRAHQHSHCRLDQVPFPDM